MSAKIVPVQEAGRKQEEAATIHHAVPLGKHTLQQKVNAGVVGLRASTMLKAHTRKMLTQERSLTGRITYLERSAKLFYSLPSMPISFGNLQEIEFLKLYESQWTVFFISISQTHTHTHTHTHTQHTRTHTQHRGTHTRTHTTTHAHTHTMDLTQGTKQN